MRTLHGAVVAVVGGLGVAGFGSVMAVGCGGDDNGVAPLDASSDVTTNPDVAVKPGDSSAGDSAKAGDAADAGTDANASDTGNALDSGADVVVSPGLAFAQQEVETLCTSLINCCPGGLDSGTYSLAECVTPTTGYGWEGTLPGDYDVFLRGKVTFDSAKATACLAAIKSFPCGMQTPAQWSAITQACSLVIQGTVAANQPGCISSWECATNTFCDPTVDGGVCRPLATVGQPCDTLIKTPPVGTAMVQDNPIPDEMCSYLASGTPPLFCDLINNGAAAPTCQPLVPDGGNCINPVNGYYDDQACVTTAALCGDNSECGGTASYPYNFQCLSWLAPPDAGDGG